MKSAKEFHSAMWLVRLCFCIAFIQNTFCDISVKNDGRTSMQTEGTDGNTQNSDQNTQESGTVTEHIIDGQSQNDNKNVKSQKYDNPSNLIPKSDTFQPGLKSQIDNIDKSNEALEAHEHALKDGAVFDTNDDHDKTMYVAKDDIFEDIGDKDESLVEQMNRLSEKIRQAQGEKSVEEMTMSSSDVSKSKIFKSKGVTNGITKSQPHVVREGDQDRKSNSGIPFKESLEDPLSSDRTINHHTNAQAIDNVQSKGTQQQSKESVIDQIQNIAKDIDAGHVFVPNVQQAEDEPGTFPEDAALDISEDASNLNINTQTQALSSDVGIQNTQPPVSNIHPTKTNDPMHNGISDEPTAGRVDNRATPTIDGIKKTLSDVVVTMKQGDVIQPTSDIPMQATKQVYNGKTKKQMRLEKRNDKLAAASTIKDSATEVNVVHTHNQRQEQSLESPVYNLHLSATDSLPPLSETVKIAISEDKAEGTIYETRVESNTETNMANERYVEDKGQKEVMPSSTLLPQGKVQHWRKEKYAIGCLLWDLMLWHTLTY